MPACHYVSICAKMSFVTLEGTLEWVRSYRIGVASYSSTFDLARWRALACKNNINLFKKRRERPWLLWGRSVNLRNFRKMDVCRKLSSGLADKTVMFEWIRRRPVTGEKGARANATCISKTTIDYTYRSILISILGIWISSTASGYSRRSGSNSCSKALIIGMYRP